MNNINLEIFLNFIFRCLILQTNTSLLQTYIINSSFKIKQILFIDKKFLYKIYLFMQI